MNKKKKLPFVVKLAILTTITVISWIAFEVYRVLTVKPAPPVPQEILAPISPELNSVLLDSLENKIFLTPEEIGDTTIQTQATTSQEQEQEEESANINQESAAEETEENESTPEGQLNE
jgi:hypothetical protein